FVQELEEVPDGATVIFSAHGVSPAVRVEAAGRELSVIDATCPLVAKVHTEVRRFTRQGYQVVLIGHPGHDEVEATRGEDPGIAVVDDPAQVAELEVDDPERVAYVTQTTLAPADVEDVLSALRGRFPDLAGPAASDICYATHNRQEGVRGLAPECDLILVVGSANSSNSNRLAEVARRCGCRAELLDDESGLDLAWLAGATRVGVTAGASAPEALVQSLVRALGGLGPVTVEERAAPAERVSFSLPLEVRS
ncbi:MAG: 4-hydroxy-3-methylbut-2-enyl diphosphate reductase, partial [Acidimicrobiales bacterium]